MPSGERSTDEHPGCRGNASIEKGPSEGAAKAELSLGGSAVADDRGGAFGAPADMPAAAPKKKAGPRRSEFRERATSGLLTAGSFDDRLNLDRFMNYWQAGSLSKKQLVPASDFKKRTGAWQRGHEALQLAFVVDVTGSMGDELNYLKREFSSIVSDVDRKYPGVKKEFALIVYRDETDAFVTRGMDFTADVSEFQEFIDEQQAGGGGDYPEAVDAALADAAEQLSWKEGHSVARMAFFIADAPAHDDKMAATFKAVRKLRRQRVAIYPVAASGVGDLAEEMMRATAVMTEGQYIFLTDDSGIGNAHAKPKFPCYHVEKLKDVMSRMVADKIKGVRSNPVAKNIVRTVGHPDRGVCKSGSQYVGKGSILNR